MSTLYVPLFIALVGIVLRGAAFALRGEAATMFEARGLGATFALSSVVVPFCFGATVGAIAAGAVTVPADAGDPFGGWTDPLPLYIGVLAGRTGRLHVRCLPRRRRRLRADLPDLVAAFRRRALGAAGVTGALAVGGIFVVNEEAPHLYDGLTSGAGLAVVIASAVAGPGDARPRRDVAVRRRPAHLGARGRRGDRRARRSPCGRTSSRAS